MIRSGVGALLLGSLVLFGCHKKSQQTGAEAGDSTEAGAPTATDAGPEAALGADDAALEASPSIEAGPDEAGGADSDSDDGGAPTIEGGAVATTGGAGFGGSFNCFGVLNLTQTNGTVAGTGTSRSGSKTQTVDVSCRIAGGKCTGNAIHFNSTNGGSPKPAGKGKITIRAVNGGLEYTETSGNGGNPQLAFCARR